MSVYNDSIAPSEYTYSDVPTSWPGVVGMDSFTAKAIIEWGSEYYVECYTYKKSRYRPRAPRFTFKDKDGNPLDENTQRVVLWLDKYGCVALTPRIE
jgi:hypothetical protein